jgi:hypothetical protein
MIKTFKVTEIKGDAWKEVFKEGQIIKVDIEKEQVLDSQFMSSGTVDKVGRLEGFEEEFGQGVFVEEIKEEKKSNIPEIPIG